MRRPLSFSSPSEGWTSVMLLALDLLNPAAVLIGVRVLVTFLLLVELKQDASRVLRVDVRLRPAVAALHAAHWLDPVVTNRLRRPVDILHVERHVVQAGAALA